MSVPLIKGLGQRRANCILETLLTIVFIGHIDKFLFTTPSSSSIFSDYQRRRSICEFDNSVLLALLKTTISLIDRVSWETSSIKFRLLLW